MKPQTETKCNHYE